YIQTFPKNFKFFGNKTELEQMIGNAVPVELAKFVAIALKRYIADKGVQRFESVPSFESLTV
ncbi:DNA cytosine methyltransferase, partial [Spirosoma utsteinense]|uniref:DNA cytosine methyltransferase n=1 Tax=Spirosoma utsteinense TaxID=2585773 RepID=UPI001647C99C